MEKLKAGVGELVDNKYKIYVSLALGWAVEKFSLLSKLLSYL